MTSSTTLIVGCGDLGTEIGLRLVGADSRVIGWRRSLPAAPSPFEFRSVDVTSSVEIPAEVTHLVVCLAPRRDGSDDYETTYISGLRNVLDAFRRRGTLPKRAVLVSSTAAYGSVTGYVDEQTPILAPTGRAKIVLEAETMFRNALGEHGTVLRCGGIYGPGRTYLIDQVRAGDAVILQESAMTNRIHRDDAAAAVVHLLRCASVAPLYLGVDEEPVEKAKVLDFLAELLGAPHPRRGSASRERGGSRSCDSTLLRSTGFRFTYPSYREGYAAILGGIGERHP